MTSTDLSEYDDTSFNDSFTENISSTQSMMAQKKATFTLVIGPMKSGKSSESIRNIKRHSTYGNVIVINSIHDTRCGESIRTHDGREVTAIKTKELTLNLADFKSAALIVIDEGQFFDQTELYIFVKSLMNLGKSILVSGLDGNSDQKAFLDLNLLGPLATSITKLSAFCERCKDGTQAYYSICISEKKENIDTEATYIPVCYYHINNK